MVANVFEVCYVCSILFAMILAKSVLSLHEIVAAAASEKERFDSIESLVGW